MSSQNKPQSQAALLDQLAKLIPIANREGLYDAADYLTKVCNPVCPVSVCELPKGHEGPHDSKW
jgi:hypothetical protein